MSFFAIRTTPYAIRTIKPMFWKVKKCSVCSKPITFEYGIFDTKEGTKFNNPDSSIYCREHFLEKIRPRLGLAFIFAEPFKEYRNYIQLFYYTIQTLPKHEYSKEDCKAVENLLNTADPRGDKNIVLLSPDVIKEAYVRPLLKIENPGFSLIDKDRFISIISDVLTRYETKYPKGAFWFCLPYSDRGIYLWFEV